MQFLRVLCERYDLNDPEDPFLDGDLKLVKAGIYSFTNGHIKNWAIPDVNVEVQNYVLDRLPPWAHVTEK